MIDDANEVKFYKEDEQMGDGDKLVDNFDQLEADHWFLRYEGDDDKNFNNDDIFGYLYSEFDLDYLIISEKLTDEKIKDKVNAFIKGYYETGANEILLIFGLKKLRRKIIIRIIIYDHEFIKSAHFMIYTHYFACEYIVPLNNMNSYQEMTKKFTEEILEHYDDLVQRVLNPEPQVIKYTDVAGIIKDKVLSLENICIK